VRDQLGIVELSSVCGSMRARSLALFEQLGAWVPTTAPGELQRLFAEACHRHAWHAELWEARRPTIAIPATSAEAPQALDPKVPDPTSGDDDRRGTYRAALAQLDEDLRPLRARVDPTLDPSTARTIDLVGRDVVELAARLESLRSR
jgi:hypothetical protein